jgi:tRNA modification GTPase
LFSTLDTIVAIATPPGRGGIGVVRLSGPEARAIARRLTQLSSPLEPRHATLTTVKAQPDDGGPRSGRGRSSAIDQVIATYFPAPASYTGDDVVELSAHGSPVVLRAIVSAAIESGARLAEPGEFTLRAYLNGRLDLMQAEAVADLIDAVTPLQARAAFDQLQGTLTQAIADIDARLFDLIARLEASVDFPEEGYHFIDPGVVGASLDDVIAHIDRLLRSARRGRLVREGLQVVIAGPPNVGKSSLFNALIGTSRAIVTEIPGTTRDLVTETVDLDGLRVTLVDTAGLRVTTDVIESEGVIRSGRALEVADVILDVSDVSQVNPSVEPTAFRASKARRLAVANKCDLTAAWARDDVVCVSALTGQGLDELRCRIAAALDAERTADIPEITNVRHITLVERARDALLRARAATVSSTRRMPEEFVLADLQNARAALEEITGKRAPEDLLEHIFTRFCVGK